MSSVWNKLDFGLSAIYADCLHVREHGLKAVPRVQPVVAEAGQLNISLQYAGDLTEIEASGFQTVWEVASGRAAGAVNPVAARTVHLGLHTQW